MDKNVDFTLESQVLKANIRFFDSGSKRHILTAVYDWNHAGSSFNLVGLQTENVSIQSGGNLISSISSELQSTAAGLNGLSQNSTWLNFVNGIFGSP